MPIAYYDGQFVEKNTLTVALSDLGLTRGLTIFELARVYGGKPFRLYDHLMRMQNGAEALGLKLPMPYAELTKKVLEIITKNNYAHSVIKFYLTAGNAGQSPYSFAGDHKFSSHLFIIEDEAKPQHPDAPYGLDFYKRGQRIKIAPCERANPSIKSINYMQGFIAAREAGSDYDDILFTHHDGYVTEVTRANFFCVIDGMLCTPDKNMLSGITRKTILEIAATLNIPHAEQTLTPADLRRASEAFTTGSFAEMVPIKQINDYILPTTMEGPVFSALRRALTSFIEKS